MRNILVVEDSPLVLKILEHLFRQEPDLQPLFCASLGEAQVLLEASSALFFAAIVDLNLPDAPHGEIVDLVLQYSLPCIVLSGCRRCCTRCNALRSRSLRTGLVR